MSATAVVIKCNSNNKKQLEWIVNVQKDCETVKFDDDDDSNNEKKTTNVKVNEPQRVALLLTGELRTFESTWKLIQKNIIDTNHCDIFIHYDASRYKEKVKFDPKTFSKYWGENVKVAREITQEEQGEYEKLSQKLMNTQAALQPQVFKRTGVHPTYMTNSGTLIEYFQIKKVSELMHEWEKQHKFTYDLVIRSRLDAVLFGPLHLASFYMDIRDVPRLWTTADWKNNVVSFICSLGNRTRFEWFYKDVKKDEYKKVVKNILETTSEWKQMETQCVVYPAQAWNACKTWIKNLQWIHTFRENVIWMGKREDCEKIYDLIFTYGAMDDGRSHIWNSESQFEVRLLDNGLTKINYMTEIEHAYFMCRCNPKLIESEKKDPNLQFTVLRPETYHSFEKCVHS